MTSGDVPAGRGEPKARPPSTSPPSTCFDDLQRQLVTRLRGSTPEAEVDGIIVCPSISFPGAELRKITGIEFYEERMLFMALLLRDPALELLYPTSLPIDDAVVDYYLGWLPDPAGARPRLHLFSVDDPEPRALIEKLLARPDVVSEMRARVRAPHTSFILPFNVTPAEAELAEALQVPVYGTHPKLTPLGSKSGSRHVAMEAGVQVFEGDADLYSLQEIEAAIKRIRSTCPQATAVVAKLNNGFSGQGSVIIDLDEFRSPLPSSPAVFCADSESWDSYGAKVEKEGAVVEELARGPRVTSPSVQLRILPGGRYEVLSTHDQILGGPDGQVYLGCRFPARRNYRAQIQNDALRVARVLASKGALGSFGIDFVVAPDRGIFLSEINLRAGGTTHPFLMARYVTGGVYDPSSGQLIVDGEPRVYTSSDNIKSDRYVGLAPAAVIGAVAEAGLAYNHRSKTGVTLHLLGALPAYGKIGVVCIAASYDEADELHRQVIACIDDLASAPRPLGPW